MKKIILFIICMPSVWSAVAQVDTAQVDLSYRLKEVVVTDDELHNFSVGQTLHHISDSILTHSRPSLTALLTYNTPIYFKENGLGMVSSPSFRGTTAQQTAVLWNGININSVFLGQTDFNTINTGIYDNIIVRAGGGSVVYGSGAIGGTVHLNTTLDFEKAFENQVYLSYGSFNTLDARYHLRVSSAKVSARFAVAHNSSDNDYAYQLSTGQNTNGQFHNTAVNTAVGVKINPQNQLNFYGEFYTGERHFPVHYLTENRTKYQDDNWRGMLEWQSRFGEFKSELKGAFLSEHYAYYPNIEKDHHSYGKAETFIGKYDLNYEPAEDILLNAVLAYQHAVGEGANIVRNVHDIFSAGFLFKHQLTSKLRYQIGLRKEFTQAYESPFLYALGVDYQVTPFYTAKLSASRNFRRPTFNDLYWANSGNLDLKAEKSLQIELGNAFTYKNWQATLTGYFNNIKDMIHWLPESGGLWSPRNEDHVQTYGAEVLLGYQQNFGKQALHVNGTYAYTFSRNKETHNQLIYVPYHKATFSAMYSLGRFSVNYQFLYVGEVYMHSDNDPRYKLSDYALSNIGLAYRLGKKNTYEIGGKVRNLFNVAYESVNGYEMAGINFNFYINLNF